MPDDNGHVDGLPANGRGHYAEAAKAQRQREGRDFEPKAYTGPRLSSIYAEKRAEEKTAERERIEQQKANLPSWVMNMPMPPTSERARQAKERIVNKHDYE